MNETTTGLPELPEGQFWRVAKTKYRMLGSGSPYTLHLMERVQCPDVIEEKNPKFRWWNFRPRKTYRKATDADRIRSLWTADISRWITDDELSPEELATMKAREASWADDMFSGGHPRMTFELTPRNIRHTAEAVLQERSEMKSIAELLGDYPPKTLN